MTEPTFDFDISPALVDPGAALTLRLKLSNPPHGEFSGRTLTVRMADSVAVAKAVLVVDDGDSGFTGQVVLRAPMVAGLHVWTATIDGEDAVLAPWGSAQASFGIGRHGSIVSAWGVPSLTVAGAAFTFKVGVKSAGASNLAGRPFRILDHHRSEVAAGRLGPDVWPHTTALYFAEVEAAAAAMPGQYAWTVEVPDSDDPVAHAAGTCTFAVKVVDAADCRVTIRVSDGERQAPIGGAHVVMHPYRAVTDRNGVAWLDVARRHYALSVSGYRYSPYREALKIDADLELNISLHPEIQDDAYDVS